MSIKRDINTVWDNDNVVELQLESGEGAEILGFRYAIANGPNCGVVDLTIDQRIMASIPIAPNPLVPRNLNNDFWRDIYEQTRARFPEVPPFRVPDGKRVVFGRPAGATTVAMIYRVLQGDQIPAIDAPGAPKGSTAWRMLLGRNRAAIPATGWQPFDQSWANLVLEKSPFEENEDLPWDFRCYGIIGHRTATVATVSDLIRMFVDDTEMLSDDSEGVPFPGAIGSPFPTHEVSTGVEMLWFEKPMDLKKGQKVRIEHHVTVVGGDALLADRSHIELVGLINPGGLAGG